MNKETSNKKMPAIMFLNLFGALLAYLIGSGTASGQESMQYFSSWGSVPSTLIVAIVTFIVMFCSFMAYTYAGRKGSVDLETTCQYYCGKTVGKIFTIFSWLFNACCYFFMISGFGNTLNQQFNFPLYVGYGIAVILSVGTAVFGLDGIVNIIGKIGPIVVGMLLLLGIFAAFKLFPHIPDGVAAMQAGKVEVLQAGANPLLAGLSFGGCSILLVASYVGKIGKDLAEYKSKYTTLLCFMGSISIVVTVCILGLCHLANIENSVTASIPNLLLANQLFGDVKVFGIIFAIVILASIYSTFCPILWTCVSTFIKDEKSAKYKLVCVAVGIGVFIVDMFIPYETLVNVIMTYCGYTGGIVFLVITICWIKNLLADKKEVI